MIATRTSRSVCLLLLLLLLLADVGCGPVPEGSIAPVRERSSFGLRKDVPPPPELDPSAKLAASRAEGILRLQWRLAAPPTDDNRELAKVVFDETGRYLLGLEWIPRFATMSHATRLHGWDLESGSNLFAEEIGHLVSDIAGGRARFATAERDAVRLRDAANGRVLWAIPGDGLTGCIALDESSGLVVASDDEKRRLAAWEMENGTLRFIVDGGWECGLMELLPGAKLVHARFSDGLNLISSTADGSLVRRFADDHFSEFTFAALSPSGRLLATNDESDVVKVWDTWTGEVVRELGGLYSVAIGPHDAEMAFLADGRILATADYGGRIRLWWLPTSEHLGDLVCGEDEYRPVLGRSPDGRRLACATESAVTIWVIDDREGAPRGAP